MRDDDTLEPPTLGYLTRDVKGVFCWCNRCGHNAVLPVAVLIAHCGQVLPFPHTHSRLRCQVCGPKDIHARPDWPSSPPSSWTVQMTSRKYEVTIA